MDAAVTDPRAGLPRRLIIVHGPERDLLNGSVNETLRDRPVKQRHRGTDPNSGLAVRPGQYRHTRRSEKAETNVALLITHRQQIVR